MQQAQQRAAQRDLGAPHAATCRSRRRRSSSRWPRSSRRRPARRRAHARRRACSSTACSKKMRLQSDPTIIYGLVGGKGTLGRGIMRSEIEQPTPYNTYVDRGPAAGPDRQSGPRLARGGRQSGAHQGTLSSSPTAPAATPSPRPTTSISATSRSCARSRSSRQVDTVRRPRKPTRDRDARSTPARRTAATEQSGARRAAGRAKNAQLAAPAHAADGAERQPRRAAAPCSADRSHSGAGGCGSTRAVRASLHGGEFQSRIHRVSRAIVHGVVEHDRLCPKPRRQRRLCLRVGVASRSTPRGFDLRLRLPPGWDAVEAAGAQARDRAAGARHGLRQSHRQARRGGAPVVRVNEDVLASVLKVAADLSAKLSAPPPTVDGILGIKGVMEVVRAGGDRGGAPQPREAAIVEGFDAALESLVEMRRREGTSLQQILARAARRDRRPGRARTPRPAASAEAVKARLAEQVALLLEQSDASIPTGCIRKRSCSPPRPISARSSTGSTRISRRRANCSARAARSAGGSISWRRNSTAK